MKSFTSRPAPLPFLSRFSDRPRASCLVRTALRLVALAFCIGLAASAGAAPAAAADVGGSDAARASTAAASFVSAKPIWPEGREKEVNLSVAFRAVFPKPSGKKVVLRLAAQALYRCHVNGRFVGHGPARAGHGFYRVDEWDITAFLASGANVVALEVAGYNANSYYLLDLPSFLQAEVLAEGKVVASTAGAGARFEAAVLAERVQKVARYSFQRTFTELWRLAPDWADWRAKADGRFSPVRCAVVESKRLLPRGVPYPTFAVKPAVALLGTGALSVGKPPAKPWRDRAVTLVGPGYAGYPEKELVSMPSIKMQAVRFAAAEAGTAQPRYAGGSVSLAKQRWALFDLGVNRSGFIAAKVVVRRPTRLLFAFDEILTDGQANWRRLGCINLVTYELQPGTYALESFEPYTLRYLNALVLDGECDIAAVGLREYVNPESVRATFASSDPKLDRIFEAARETFAQNAVDVFMDCPSRERAGWLCDSFFTARIARSLCGNTSVERNFLENYQLPDRFPHLPEGMLPMCYPADHTNGNFIPNWALWLVLELEEYAARTGDRALVSAFRPRLEALMRYFKPFENEDGLLEKLEKWVFVEWSAANKFTQSVNYPSNMLYAGALSSMGRLYGDAALLAKAEKIRDTIRRQSFDGAFFVDNAEREGGKLKVTRNRTEVCQYYAFFFDVATPATHPELWRALTTDFGPRRAELKLHPEIHPANAFIGNQLRFELLSRQGRRQQILDEAAGYWLYMAERTGTLWEHDKPSASCNHGFAAHAGEVLLRDVLGLREVNHVARTVRVEFADLKLDACRGSVPTADGAVSLDWEKRDGRIRYALTFPKGWKADVRNASGLELVKR